jgi:P-type Ca2+ transporter type 2C
VKVIRGGKPRLISIYDVVVGDIMHLEAGDIVSTDGVLVNGYNIKCDESSATGESDAVLKTPASIALRKSEVSADYDPFIVSGSKVLEGTGGFLVTAVGPNSYYGRTLTGRCLSVKVNM